MWGAGHGIPDSRPLADWSTVGKIQFQPKPGSDITKILFADFRWVSAGTAPASR